LAKTGVRLIENKKARTIMKYKPTYSDKQRDAARQRKEEEGRKRNVQEETGKTTKEDTSQKPRKPQHTNS
jgi:hypothetical protein